MPDYPVLKTVIARKLIYGDEASRNEGKMMETELDSILAALEAAEQSVQRTCSKCGETMKYDDNGRIYDNFKNCFCCFVVDFVL